MVAPRTNMLAVSSESSRKLCRGAVWAGNRFDSPTRCQCNLSGMHARLNRSCNTTTSHTLLGPSPIRYIKLASLLYPYTRLRFECMPTVLTYMSRVVERCPAIQVDMRFTTCRAGQNFMCQCCLSNGSLRGHRGYCRAYCVTAATRVRARN